ncbi:MAG: hypothetical protein WDN49_18665 [Acetobacteraceae bacterium]
MTAPITVPTPGMNSGAAADGAGDPAGHEGAEQHAEHGLDDLLADRLAIEMAEIVDHVALNRGQRREVNEGQRNGCARGSPSHGGRADRRSLVEALFRRSNEGDRFERSVGHECNSKSRMKPDPQASGCHDPNRAANVLPHPHAGCGSHTVSIEAVQAADF